MGEYDMCCSETFVTSCTSHYWQRIHIIMFSLSGEYNIWQIELMSPFRLHCYKNQCFICCGKSLAVYLFSDYCCLLYMSRWLEITNLRRSGQPSDTEASEPDADI